MERLCIAAAYLLVVAGCSAPVSRSASVCARFDVAKGQYMLVRVAEFPDNDPEGLLALRSSVESLVRVLEEEDSDDGQNYYFLGNPDLYVIFETNGIPSLATCAKVRQNQIGFPQYDKILKGEFGYVVFGDWDEAEVCVTNNDFIRKIVSSIVQ